LKNDKKSIRKLILSRRNALSEKDYFDLSRRVCANLESEFLSKRKNIMGFVPVNKEVYIMPLLEKISRSGVLILPKVTDHEIEPVKVDDLGSLSKGYKGIPEPTDGTFFYDIDAVLVPGVAFSRQGARIGYGGGFYDRFLKKIRSVFIAPAFSFQLTSYIDSDDFDVPVNFIVTENETIRCNDFNKGENNE